MAESYVWQYAVDGMISAVRFRPTEFAKALHEEPVYPRYATAEVGWANLSPEHSALIEEAFTAHKACTLAIRTNKPGHESFPARVIREPSSNVNGSTWAGYQVTEWSVRWIRRKQIVVVNQNTVPVPNARQLTAASTLRIPTVHLFT
jgi:hypothetical protein